MTALTERCPPATLRRRAAPGAARRSWQPRFMPAS